VMSGGNLAGSEGGKRNLVSSRSRREISGRSQRIVHSILYTVASPTQLTKPQPPNSLKIMSDSATPVGLAVPTRKPVPAPAAEEAKDTTHTPSQRYLSTRGGSYGVSAARYLLVW